MPITLATYPAGLALGINGTTVTGPTTVTSWKGYPLNLTAAGQNDATGRAWSFVRWSDGGAAGHQVLTSGTAKTFTATFDAPALFRDSFESGDLSKWTSSDGMVVQSREVFDGAYAARATSTGAAAFAATTLETAQPELFVRFHLLVADRGATNVSLAKTRAVDGTAALTLHLSSSGALCLRIDRSATSVCSGITLDDGSWHVVEVHGRTGSDGVAEVWLDGVRLSALSGPRSLGAAAFGRVQLGDNQTGRSFDIVSDRVIVDSLAIGAVVRREAT